MRVLVSTLMCVILACLSLPATAQDDESNPVGACLQADMVWLIVVDEHDQVRSNQCVGTPSTGEEALAEGGMRISRNRNGLICSIDAHPNRCPSTFTGQFWNYHHARPGAIWEFSEMGAAQRTPAPGSIEGWCYNAAGTEQCSPPVLKVIQQGEALLPEGVPAEDVRELPVTTHQAVPLPSTALPWLTLGAIGMLLTLLAIGGSVASRRRGITDDILGGR